MMYDVMHCVKCKALIYTAEQVDGYGLRCGCLKKYVAKVKKNADKWKKSQDG